MDTKIFALAIVAIVAVASVSVVALLVLRPSSTTAQNPKTIAYNAPFNESSDKGSIITVDQISGDMSAISIVKTDKFFGVTQTASAKDNENYSISMVFNYSSAYTVTVLSSNGTKTYDIASGRFALSVIVVLKVSNQFSDENVFFTNSTFATVYIRNAGIGTLTISSWYWTDSNGNNCSGSPGLQIAQGQVGRFDTNVSSCPTMRFYSGYTFTLTVVSSGGNGLQTSWVR